MPTSHKKGQKPPPDELTAENIIAELCEMSGMTKDEFIEKSKEFKMQLSNIAKINEKAALMPFSGNKISFPIQVENHASGRLEFWQILYIWDSGANKYIYANH